MAFGTQYFSHQDWDMSEMVFQELMCNGLTGLHYTLLLVCHGPKVYRRLGLQHV